MRVSRVRPNASRRFACAARQRGSPRRRAAAPFDVRRSTRVRPSLAARVTSPARRLERYGRHKLARGDLPGGRALLEEAQAIFARLGVRAGEALRRVIGEL